VRLDPVSKHHSAVVRIQPTWHCLLRFRQRVELPPGTDVALSGLAESLDRADLTAMAPAWLAGREQDARMWALDADLAFPLTPAGDGTWMATTCLRRGR
jgi:hypothetical protein